MSTNDSVALTQCLMGMECNDFVILAADLTYIKSAFIMNADEDKLLPISDRILMGINGENGEILQFSQFIGNNLSLYQLRNGYKLDTAATVHFTRKTLADTYKNYAKNSVSLLIGGWDETNRGQLYVIDFLASCMRVPIAANGYAGLTCLGILAHHYRKDMTESQAYEVMQMCVKEIHHRYALNMPNFQVKVVSEHGITSLPIVYAPRVVASPGLELKPPDPVIEQNPPPPKCPPK